MNLWRGFRMNILHSESDIENSIDVECKMLNAKCTSAVGANLVSVLTFSGTASSLLSSRRSIQFQVEGLRE